MAWDSHARRASKNAAVRKVNAVRGAPLAVNVEDEYLSELEKKHGSDVWCPLFPHSLQAFVDLHSFS